MSKSERINIPDVSAELAAWLRVHSNMPVILRTRSDGTFYLEEPVNGPRVATPEEVHEYVLGINLSAAGMLAGLAAGQAIAKAVEGLDDGEADAA